MENWKDIQTFEGCFQVSDRGNVRSLDRFAGGKRPRMIKGKLISLIRHPRGYRMVGLNDNGKEFHLMVHRLVANAFVDNPDNKPCVNHIDGDKTNNIASNLEWVSYKENSKHAVYIGKIPVGEQCNLAKLTEEEVRNIKRRKGTISSRKLSKEIGINYGTIISIWSGKSWKCVSV